MGHFVENGRRPRTGKWHASAPKTLNITYFDTAKSTYLESFLYNFQNKPSSETERYPDKGFAFSFLFNSSSFYYAPSFTIVPKWFLYEGIIDASNSARFCIISQASLNRDFPSGETIQRKLPPTTPGANQKHLKYFVKKNRRTLISFYEAHKEVTKAGRNRSALMIVLVTAKCTTTA